MHDVVEAVGCFHHFLGAGGTMMWGRLYGPSGRILDDRRGNEMVGHVVMHDGKDRGAR